ncbi:hypothetical protein D3C87_2083490 [compost metagenome]
MRHLAQQMNPGNPVLGQRRVIHLMDAGMRLSQHFDMDLAALLPTTHPIPAFPTAGQDLAGDEA